ncbi:MAG: pseudouridine synthase [Pseudomonadota bacterium]
MSEKLQKVIANTGRGSRREVERWIEAGRISVNGKSAKLGDRVDDTDKIAIDGKLIQINAGKNVRAKLLLYHKGEGKIVSRSDPGGRPTVFEDLPNLANGRWIAIGRLDLNTSGLLLFSNDGGLANKMMHPSTGIEREYLVRVRGRISGETLTSLVREGVVIDGKNAKFERLFPADQSEEGTNHWYRAVIKEGRNREVRKMFEEVGHTVSRLKRIRYGTIQLTRDLKQNKSTLAAPQQLSKLLQSYGLNEYLPTLTSRRPARSKQKRSNTTRSKKR